MELRVLAPLSTLLGMFASPQKLIQKRYDKLLDYCSQLDSRSSKEEQGLAKKDYEALNAQLLEELRFFNQAVRTVLTNCLIFIAKFIRELMDEAQPPVQHLPVRLSKCKWMTQYKKRMGKLFCRVLFKATDRAFVSEMVRVKCLAQGRNGDLRTYYQVTPESEPATTVLPKAISLLYS